MKALQWCSVVLSLNKDELLIQLILVSLELSSTEFALGITLVLFLLLFRLLVLGLSCS